MTRSILFLFFVCISTVAGAQIQVAKLIGKNSNDFNLGFGGFLKLGYPVSEAADVTLEGGANFFLKKTNTAYGWATIPVKLGFRYTLNGSGAGLYIEPQAGYNVHGIYPNDDNFKGPVYAGQVGYLFQPAGKIQFDLGVLFESAHYSGGSVQYASFRLTHNFSFRRSDSE